MGFVTGQLLLALRARPQVAVGMLNVDVNLRRFDVKLHLGHSPGSRQAENVFDERAEVLDIDGTARPEMASLTLGSLNFPKQASVNDPEMITRLATRMQERGIVPELEVFDIGMLDYDKFLMDRQILRGPHYVNFLLGSLGTLSAPPCT